MKLVGLTRVKNEEMMMQEHLDHMAKFCDSICVYDDRSTNGTLEIIKNHPKVKKILRTSKRWKPKPVGTVKDPLELWKKNQKMLNAARRSLKPDWFIFLDIDEFFDEDLLRDLPKLLKTKDYDAICFQMYDFFITEKDKDKPYKGDIQSIRSYAGTEYRDQLFLFRNISGLYFKEAAHKEPIGFKNDRILYTKYKIKHYGKAKSVEDYYQKSKHYLKYRPHLRKSKFKFTQPPVRKDKSDLGKLVKWEEIKKNLQARGSVFCYRYKQPKNMKSHFKYQLDYKIDQLRKWIKRAIFGIDDSSKLLSPANLNKELTLDAKETHILEKKERKKPKK